jgi:hypothetical protein
MIVALFATSRLLHASIATGMMGMMGMMFPIYAIPAVTLAFGIWAVASPRLPVGIRRATMVATILLACAAFSLMRTNGINGAGSDLAWRRAPTAEQRLPAHCGNGASASRG